MLQRSAEERPERRRLWRLPLLLLLPFVASFVLFHFLPDWLESPVIVGIILISALGMVRASDGVGYWRAMTEVHLTIALMLDPERTKDKSDDEVLREIVEALHMNTKMKLPAAKGWQRVMWKTKRSRG